MIEKSIEIDKLAEALSKAQGQMDTAKKDSSNPFFKSSYADLASVWEACRKPLSDNGLSVTQLVSQEGGWNGTGIQSLQTVLLHSSGQYISSTLQLSAKDNTPQAVGSALTYARRYGLSAILGIASDDDDGESAQGRETKPKAQTITPKQTDPASKPTEGVPVTYDNLGRFSQAVKDEFGLFGVALLDALEIKTTKEITSFNEAWLKLETWAKKQA